MSFYIGNIWPLLLVLFIVPVVYLAWHSLTGLSPWRSWSALLLRIVLLLLLIAALADIQVVRKSKALSVLFLLDNSESVPTKVQERAVDFIRTAMTKMDARHDRAGLLVFAGDASFEFIDRPKNFHFETIQSKVETGQTNIDKALKLAIAALPETGQRRIVLLSDGNQTIDDCLEQAEQARSHQIPIDVVPLLLRDDREVILNKLVAPGEINAAQAYQVTAVISSSRNTVGTVRLYLNGEFIREKGVQLQAGKNSVSITVPGPLVKSGFHKLRVVVESPDDLIFSNNVAESFCYAHGIPKVLYLEGDLPNRRFLQEALTNVNLTPQQRIDLVIGDVNALPQDILSMHGYDALILSNIARQDLSNTQMLMIENAVKEGGLGFIMIGGENSFGAGGYRDTPIERALPVDMDITHKKVVPNGALVLILHTCEFPDGNRWAKIISKKAIDVLSPFDLAGILYYSWNTRESWLFPLKPVVNKMKMFQLIEQVSPGDMPSFGPTLNAANQALITARAGKKHIIVISDGDPTPPSLALMQQIKQNKISISSVVIRPHGGQDTGKMRYLSQYTGGQYHRIDNPKALPAIFIKEALTVKRSLIFESDAGFTPRLAYHTDIVRGFAAGEFPRIYGYVVTSAKPLASVPLYIQHEEQKDPLLAHINYGLGRSVAFTSDAKNRWSADWIAWEKYQKFWVQTVRWALRKIERSGFQIATSVSRGKGHIVIDAVTSDGRLLNFLGMKAAVVYPSGRASRFKIYQTGPGRYEGKFNADEVGTYLITGTYLQQGKQKHFSTGLAVAYSAEYSHPGTNQRLLKQLARLTGGRVITYSFMDQNGDGVVSSKEWSGSASDFDKRDYNQDGVIAPEEHGQDEKIFRHDEARGGRPQPLWPLLLTIFLVLFPLDVFLRRVLIDYRRLWRKLTAWHQRERQDSSSATMQRLANTKKAVQKKWRQPQQQLDLKSLEKLGRSVTPPQPPKDQAQKTKPGQQATPTSESGQKSADSGQKSPPTSRPPGESDYTSRLLAAKKKIWDKNKKKD